MTVVTEILELLESMAVVVVVAYLLTRTRWFGDIVGGKLGWRERAYLILIFGALSIWGTLSGVEVLDAVANTRDLGPALGGLVGGPIVGLGAGLIGAVQRLLMGGFTAAPCSIATVIAGLSGGVVWLLFKRQVAPVWAAVLLAVFTESVHMGITLLMARPFDDSLELVSEIALPMIAVNAAGMGLFVFIVHNVRRERETRAEKQRMEGELDVAREIQQGIVPSIFPPFPDREEFELHATLETAREVGGDLYDFQMFDDGRLYVAVGDVSGKGAPASLFMAVTITLMRAVSETTSVPGEVLTKVNASLCRENDSAMFVTLFYGVYDVRSGELSYSSGGHPSPYVLRADGSVEQLPKSAGAGLGVSERIAFGTERFQLGHGDCLFLYSDGVTEAMNAAGQWFGDERLRSVLAGIGAPSGAQAVLDPVTAAVDDFVAGEEQYDDTTTLALRRT